MENAMQDPQALEAHIKKHHTRHINDDDYKKAAKRNNGNISDIARELGVTRATVHTRINKNPDLQRLVNDLRTQAEHGKI